MYGHAFTQHEKTGVYVHHVIAILSDPHKNSLGAVYNF